MATKKLSNIAFDPVVQQINRKFATRKTTCTNKYYVKGDHNGAGDQPTPSASNVVIPGTRYMGAYGRTVRITGVGLVQKNTFFMRNPMQAAQPTAEALTARANFAKAVNWAREGMEDLQAIVVNQNRFIESKDDKTKTIKGKANVGYQTIRGYVAGMAYAIVASGEELPANYQLPAFDA